MNEDIRWIQRFNNYKKGLKQLNDAVILSKNRELSLLEKQGLIQAFEFTHELAWNLLKDYLEYQGNQEIRGSRDAIREAFKVGLIVDGQKWMETIQARNITSHSYDEAMVQSAFETIVNQYILLFEELKNVFEKLQNKEQNA
ncbi:MAG: nucleotidyltransferase substrate binding protein [Candidatus Omnitrophica bacterium]|nr:nucleotidyltransferase substrate binding protein [Candidatus Omnitrophota bacterium]